jgi:hypothetical protein
MLTIRNLETGEAVGKNRERGRVEIMVTRLSWSMKSLVSQRWAIGFVVLLLTGTVAYPEKGYAVSYEKLHSFGKANDGAVPLGRLISGQEGVLYGTTLVGGTDGSGTVFELVPPSASNNSWSESVLYSFTGIAKLDGANPQAGLVAGADGTLYGTASNFLISGGGGGAVFSLSPPTTSGGAWHENTLHVFADTFGSQTTDLLLPRNDVLLGTTALGGATQMAPYLA